MVMGKATLARNETAGLQDAGGPLSPAPSLAVPQPQPLDKVPSSTRSSRFEVPDHLLKVGQGGNGWGTGGRGVLGTRSGGGVCAGGY